MDEAIPNRSSFTRARQRLGCRDDREISPDPLLIDKVRDVVWLYLAPPANAAVFAVDEKPQIQATERTEPVLPMLLGTPRAAQPWHRADQAVHRRDHPAHRPGQAARRQADQPRPARLHAALVTTAQAAPRCRPLAPPQRLAAGRQDRVTGDGWKGVTPCNRTSETEVTLTLSGSAATRRKTATVVRAPLPLTSGTYGRLWEV